MEPRFRSIWLGILVPDSAQLRDPAIALVAKSQDKHPATVPRRSVSESRNVGREVCYCGHQPGPRFCAVKLETLCSDNLGLGDPSRKHRAFSDVAFSVHPFSANDFNLGGSRTDRAEERGKIVNGLTVIEEPPDSVPVEKSLYGLLAEFEEHEQVLAAANRAYAEGYRAMDAYSPFPVEGLAEALGHHTTIVPLLTLLGGIAGGLGGYFMQWYSMGRLYPLNVGGRPLNSWPNFIPITFELTVLIAALSAFVAMLFLNRLPQPHHPVFDVPEFRRASIDRFFLCIEARDEKFDRNDTWKFLEGLSPCSLSEVEDEG